MKYQRIYFADSGPEFMYLALPFFKVIEHAGQNKPFCIEDLKRRVRVLYLISLMIFIGGIGRIVSMVTFGVPSAIFIILTLMELFFPLFIPWQRKIAQA